MEFEQEFTAFRLTVLRELAGLRQEVRELRLALQGQTPPAEPRSEAPWRDVFRGLPASLEKRLEPLLAQNPPDQPKLRAQWLLEISENVEDFLRYEGDDWSESAPFLERLRELEERCGLERLTPQEGDAVDHQLHLILQSVPNPERRDQVARCARPGFIYAGEMLRRAEVVVFL
ncbi:MAG: nucleotide exchange factor GrpE [Candidatus Eremiobacteraeota bacterium]|nr:nucleotide exchange factor GrpE [Candidatus Eremiobacteraeota bacterium]MCW5870734.1 nucleotide exchange factor GrpE [Candidatus Eremiobacteraeota bacterium]